MKILDSTEDMMKLGRWMAFTKHDDIKARQKSLSLVKVWRILLSKVGRVVPIVIWSGFPMGRGD